MEVVGRMITETKRLASEEKDLRTEVSQLKSQLIVEEFELERLEKGKDSLNNETSGAKQSIETAKNQIDFTESLRDTLMTLLMLKSFMRKFVEKADPTVEKQMSNLRELDAKYQNLLKRYEENPTYQAILLEEASERELRRLVAEKNNETMRLDAQREF